VNRPQAGAGAREAVEQSPASSTAWGRPNADPTWENTAFSTIHSSYYCYWSYLMNTKKS